MGSQNLLPAPQAPMQQFSPAQFEQFAQQQESVPQFRNDLPPAVAMTATASSLRPGAVAGFSGALGAEPDRGSALLGPAFLAVGAGAMVGGAKAGFFGAAAGALYGGSAINAVRAFRAAKTDRTEAVVSGTFAIVGAGVATWLLWKRSSKASVAKTEG